MGAYRSELSLIDVRDLYTAALQIAAQEGGLP